MKANYNENCTVETKWVSDVFEIDFSGRFTYENVQSIKNVIGEKISESQYYIIDLSKTNRMDSTGLGLFVAIVRNYLLKNSKLVIVNSNPNMKELFAVSRLNSYFATVDSTEEALELLYDSEHEVWKRLLRV